jgi:hypothetical protein
MNLNFLGNSLLKGWVDVIDVENEQEMKGLIAIINRLKDVFKLA